VNGSFKLAAPLVAALAIAACNASGSSNMPTTAGTSQAGQSSSVSRHIPEWQAKHLARAACPQVVGKPTCLALIEQRVRPASCSPSSCGFVPADLQTRYDLPSSTKGSGQTVAIVDAFDEPDASSDLATYRTQFGLGTANFTKYNEDGKKSNYPESCADVSGGGWCVEEDLDIEMVSAICPNCTIYLVEGDGSTTGFEKAEASAVSLGATIVSNSWICYGSPDCGDPYFSTYFDTPGVAYLAGSGDAGYDNIGAPSALASVVAVGGTQIHKSGSPPTYTETIWDGAGAGCASSSIIGSPGIPKPSWQHDSDCTYRTDADVSAQAGVSPGVAEYDSNEGGWFGVGGTSVAGPITAGVFALAGNATSQNAAEYFWTKADHQRLNDLHRIKSGNDGSCDNEYLCQAGTKQYHNYSGPGGWGTPEGVRAY
jgi:subtilase family serine protease